MAMAQFDLEIVRIFRMLRTLRPLRVISKNVEMKMIVIALLDSVGHIFNTLIVVGVVFLMFAILGVNFFAGRFFFCSVDPYDNHTEDQCLYNGGSWEVHDCNFDNVVNAMITLYVVSSLEGWPNIMF